MNSDDIQRLITAQQQQLEAQNRMIAEMQAQTASRDKAYEDLLKQFGNIGVSPSTSSALPKKKKTRASTGSMPHQPPVSTPSTSKKTPTSFKDTKECFFLFIRVMWGLILAGAVPKAPDPALMEEFNARLSNVSEIAGVLDNHAAQSLIDDKEVITLAEARHGRMKVGKGIFNIKDFFLLFTRAMLAKLGIRVWCPDLDASEDSMWNEACRISAICIFRQWAIADAFITMNINKSFINNILLLERTYNHYVFHVCADKYKQELKGEGTNKVADERRAAQTCRRRLMAYVAKTLVYRSAKANQMIWQVDEHMWCSKEINGTRVQSRPRLRPKTPKMSTFTKPPKKFPIDFFNADWFNNSLLLAQKLQVADIHKVIFLPNPTLSLLGTPHPDKKLNDKKFTEKHWADATKDYCMDQLINQEEEENSDSDEDGDDESHDGDSIDLDETDGEDDGEEEDEDYEEEEEEDEDDDDDVGNDFEEEGAPVGKGKGKAPAGSGPYFVDDTDVYVDEEAEDEGCALRLDAWQNA
ncbi:uncharacterized protein MELLADRAFT_102169 [Melampsora larici-populina 98AG31]|uniref:Uncharacterized protein n=1 Tax=Melampsora larici-populina (strain 98AG31 / pathotype 3-4-7) TaxID=747676 RepID=F4R7F0_MELLP|nr:uncharacterized protein MELLADRAFT_102169 [Melampsora larici-populina 98AG31]EGG11304.1 hypothetical protein MELLADRAFT_102169 [Melampsora larici-populina 98AG31]